jgi:phasin
MSKKAAEHHKEASEHLTHAARHNGEAAKHHEAGSHEKAVSDKGAAIASETLEKGKAAAEQATRAVQQSYSITVDNIRDFNIKMIDMAQANAEAVFEFARQLATAKQPSDMIKLWTAHAEKQFDLLTEQTKELSSLGQKIAGESVEPITRGVNQAFKKAS